MIIKERLAIHILIAMKENNVSELLNAMTADEVEMIMKDWLKERYFSNKISLQMVSSRLRKLEKLNLVKKGLKSSYMNSYFVTELGSKEVEESGFYTEQTFSISDIM